MRLRVLPKPECELFVYYRVHDAAQALHALELAFAGLRRTEPQLQASCLQRQDERGTTLLELYSHPQGIDPAREAVIAAAVQPAIATWLAEPRHIERFIRCI
jgi:Domain of unknown function (DUF4936)